MTSWVALGFLYLATRLWHYTQFPLFIDEGVYLWFAESQLGGNLVRGFGEGKPLIGWLIAVPMALGLDWISAARLPHVLAGLLGSVSLSLLAYLLFGRGTALVTALLVICTPVLLFLERLATPDVIMSACAMTGSYLALLAMRQNRWQWSLLSGIFLIAAVLAKSPIGLFFMLLPFLLWWAERQSGRQPSRRQLVLVYSLPLLFVAFATLIVAYRLGNGLQPPGFGLHEVFAKTGGSYSLGERLLTNLHLISTRLDSELSWLLIMLLFAAIASGMITLQPYILVLALLAGMWAGATMLTSNMLPSRYLLPALYPSLIMMGWVITLAGKHLAALLARYLPVLSLPTWRGIVVVTFTFTLLWTTYPMNRRTLSGDPTTELAAGYTNGFGSGHGLEKAATLLAQQLATTQDPAQIVLMHVGDYTRLKAYMDRIWWPRIRQTHLVNRIAISPAEQRNILTQWLEDAPITYVVVESARNWDTNMRTIFPQAERIAHFDKPGGLDAVEIWQITKSQ
jgi:4-amino-4-deoxy-L-arabinose transferase-like glycosyltransferase